MNYAFHSEAEAEFKYAIDYYEEQMGSSLWLTHVVN